MRQQLYEAWELDDYFWQVNALVDQKPEMGKAGRFFLILKRTYTDSITVRIRRMVDQRKDVVSLWRILDALRRHSKELTRERFRALCSDESATTADKWFDELAGPGQDHISQKKVLEQQKALESAVESVLRYANENVAHIAASPTEEPTKYSEARQALLTTLKVLRWLRLLLERSGLRYPEPKSTDLNVFRRRWLEPGESNPDFRSLGALLGER